MQIKKYNLEAWQETVIANAIAFEFILDCEVEKAVDAIKKYDNEEMFFNICSESSNTLEKLLTDASQV